MVIAQVLRESTLQNSEDVKFFVENESSDMGPSRPKLL